MEYPISPFTKAELPKVIWGIFVDGLLIGVWLSLLLTLCVMGSGYSSNDAFILFKAYFAGSIAGSVWGCIITFNCIYKRTVNVNADSIVFERGPKKKRYSISSFSKLVIESESFLSIKINQKTYIRIFLVKKFLGFVRNPVIVALVPAEIADEFVTSLSRVTCLPLYKTTYLLFRKKIT